MGREGERQLWGIKRGEGHDGPSCIPSPSALRPSGSAASPYPLPTNLSPSASAASPYLTAPLPPHLSPSARRVCRLVNCRQLATSRTAGRLSG